MSDKILDEKQTLAYKRQLFGHPVGLMILFFTEMWERFSYYGMRGLLILFLIAEADQGIQSGYGWSRENAYLLYGIYTALVYIMSIPGGIMADKVWGQKKSVMIGGFLLVAGHAILGIDHISTFYIGLALIIFGVGLLKPNISTMVGGLYKKGDVRRDSGFTIFYMGINLGSLIATLSVSYVASVYGWHWGFGLAGFGMLLGQIVYIWGQKFLKHVGNHDKSLNINDVEAENDKEEHKDDAASKPGEPFTKKERDRLIVLSISFLIVIIFWMAFEQAGGLMNIYTEYLTDKTMFGSEVPAPVFQGLNAGYILLFGPLVAFIWAYLAKKGKETSSIFKMGLGTAIMGLGYIFMVAASSEAEYARVGEEIVVQKQSSLHWIFLAYLFHTLGELALSPVALSFITKVAPKKVVASMMGFYFAATGLANFLAAWVGKQSEVLGENAVFWGLVVFSVTMGLILMIFSKRLKKLTHGYENVNIEAA